MISKNVVAGKLVSLLRTKAVSSLVTRLMWRVCLHAFFCRVCKWVRSINRAPRQVIPFEWDSFRAFFGLFDRHRPMDVRRRWGVVFIMKRRRHKIFVNIVMHDDFAITDDTLISSSSSSSSSFCSRNMHVS